MTIKSTYNHRSWIWIAIEVDYYSSLKTGALKISKISFELLFKYSELEISNYKICPNSDGRISITSLTFDRKFHRTLDTSKADARRDRMCIT